MKLISNCNPDIFYGFAEDFCIEMELESRESREEIYELKSIEMALISSFLIKMNGN